MLTKLSKNESVIVLSSGSDILLTTPVVHGYQIDTVNFTTLKEFLDTSSFALYFVPQYALEFGNSPNSCIRINMAGVNDS